MHLQPELRGSSDVTKIQFLGTSAAVPDTGDDTASFVINDCYLVDMGWSVVHNLRVNGINPLDIQYVFFTHLHHDHYLSLPSLLYYWWMHGQPLQKLKIIGPQDDIERVVDLALQFLQAGLFFGKQCIPTVIPLRPGQVYESEMFRLETHDTIHPVQGLCYRFEDQRTHKVFSFTGDTAYHPRLANHIRGSELLIHDASLGPIAADPSDNSTMHSGAIDAARLANDAGVKRLVLIHGMRSTAQACVTMASQVFSGSVLWPEVGETILI